MSERKFSFNIPSNNNSKIGSAGDELRKVEAKEDFDFRIIPIEKIVPNSKNDYPMEDIEKIMESIGNYKLIHNLRVKPTEEGLFTIISGERRFRGIIMGIEKNDPRFEKFRKGIPCMVEDKTQDEITEEIQLILANEDTRGNDEIRKRKKIARLAELFEMRNEQTGENKSISKQVASELDVSERTAQRYLSVNKLIPKLQEAFDNSKINLTTASKFAAMDISVQEMIAELFEEKNSITKEEIEIISRRAKENEEKLNKKVLDLTQRADEVERVREDLLRRIKENEGKLEENQLSEENLRAKIKEELESQNPDKEKVKLLKEQIESINAESDKSKVESLRIRKQYEEQQKELEKLRKQVADQDNSQAKLSPEEIEKMKNKYEVSSLLNSITKQLKDLSSASKKLANNYGEPIEGIGTFYEETKKMLEELRSYSN